MCTLESWCLRVCDLPSLVAPNTVILTACPDDVTKWKHFPRYWPFVRGIHRSPVNSTHKGQWRVALMFSLIYAWRNGRVNNRDAGDLRRHRAHYDVSVMYDATSHGGGGNAVAFCMWNICSAITEQQIVLNFCVVLLILLFVCMHVCWCDCIKNEYLFEPTWSINKYS